MISQPDLVATRPSKRSIVDATEIFHAIKFNLMVLEKVCIGVGFICTLCTKKSQMVVKLSATGPIQSFQTITFSRNRTNSGNTKESTCFTVNSHLWRSNN